jgi:large subunit ribosomal protein L31
MREAIHPEYVEAKVKCSCGNAFTTRSTKADLHIELCDLCHPFYTGQQKFVDTGGRVQRFADKFGGAADTVAAKEAAAKAARQKAHEDSVIAARQVREVREREEAEVARKEAARAPKATTVVEDVAAEPVVEDSAAEIVEEVVADEAVADEAPGESVEEAAAEVAVEEAAAEPDESVLSETIVEPTE